MSPQMVKMLLTWFDNCSEWAMYLRSVSRMVKELWFRISLACVPPNARRDTERPVFGGETMST